MSVSTNTHLRALFDSLPIAVLLADDRACYVDANKSACALFQRQREELIGAAVSDVIAPNARAVVEVQWQAFLRDGEQSGVFEIVLPSGASQRVHFHARANFVPGLHCSFMTALHPAESASNRELLTVCAWSKRVRLGEAWIPIEEYLARVHGLEVTHGIAPDAFARMMGGVEGL